MTDDSRFWTPEKKERWREERREIWREHAELQDAAHALDAIIIATDARNRWRRREGNVYTDGTRRYRAIELPELRRIPVRDIRTGVRYVSEAAARKHWGSDPTDALEKRWRIVEEADGTPWIWDSPEYLAWLAIVAPHAEIVGVIVGREEAQP